MRFILLLLLPFQAMAVEHWIPQPYTGTVYIKKHACPGTCYSLGDGPSMLDPKVVKLEGSALVEDPIKKAARDAKRSEDENKETAKETKRQEVKAQVRALFTKGTLSAAEEKQVLYLLLELAQ